eukprot:116796-Chlamydomonas_euryale.AAC.5
MLPARASTWDSARPSLTTVGKGAEVCRRQEVAGNQQTPGTAEAISAVLPKPGALRAVEE